MVEESGRVDVGRELRHPGLSHVLHSNDEVVVPVVEISVEPVEVALLVLWQFGAVAQRRECLGHLLKEEGSLGVVGELSHVEGIRGEEEPHEEEIDDWSQVF